MTPREKHLRTALSQAKQTFNEIDCTVDTPLAEKGMEDAEKAKQEADLMQDGPSEEEKNGLLLAIQNHRRTGHDPDYKDGVPEGNKGYCNECWAYSKLKAIWGIE